VTAIKNFGLSLLGAGLALVIIAAFFAVLFLYGAVIAHIGWGVDFRIFK
jgi:hypothetical protein